LDYSKEKEDFMNERLLLFFPPYKKNHFYQLMGVFFAERVYQQQFPYLVNNERCYWYVVIDEANNVVAFSYYEEGSQKIELGEFYEKGQSLHLKKFILRKMMTDIQRKYPEFDIYASTNNKSECELLQAKGFVVYRETKSYLFLKRSVLLEERNYLSCVEGEVSQNR